MEILYKVHNNLYVNLTNKCPCACTFCLRQNMDHVGESKSLWLEREPSAEEVIAEFAKFDMSRFNEVVFCGFGEPTEAFEVLKKVAAFVKETYHMPIRLNTNGRILYFAPIESQILRHSSSSSFVIVVSTVVITTLDTYFVELLAKSSIASKDLSPNLLLTSS